MKKTKLTRSLLAACSIVALSAVMYGCVHNGGSDTTTDETDMEMGPTPEEQIAALQGQINALRTQLGLEADDNLSTSIADLQAEVTRLQGEIDKRDTAANTAKMKALYAGVKQEALQDPAYDDDEIQPSVAVVDGKVTVKFAAATVTDFTGIDASKLADSALETTRGSAAMMKFTEYYVADNFDTAPTITGDVLTLNDAVADDIKMHSSGARFPKTGRVQYSATTASEAVPNTSTSLSGTLRRANGYFKCSGDCFISGDPKSGYEFTGTWTFDPTGDDTAQVSIPDTDFANWGWWAYMRPDQTIRVGAFASSTDTEAGAPADTLTGSANYEGEALGKYAINNQPIGGILEAGHFTATAKLSINFGADDAAFAATSPVSGTIDGFMTDGGVDKSEWSVSLNGDGTPAFAAGDADAFGTTTWSIGDSESSLDLSGDDALAATNAAWTAGFYHDGDPRNDGTPAYAIGMFKAAHGTNAYMTGAFQADNTAADTPSSTQ